MSALASESFGPVRVSTASDRVDAFVAATGDDAERWVDVAPPSYAAVALISVAAKLLESAVAEFGAVVHTRQRFEWSDPLVVGSPMAVSGEVVSARERSGATFVEFAASTEQMRSTSHFLMAAEAADLEAVSEPPPVERGETEVPARYESPPALDEPITPLRKSASRLDVVKYASASGDWNPIHWDHASAAAAGLGGIVAHGLLIASWLSQAASRYSMRPDPLAWMEIRFRNPLRPAASVRVDGAVSSVAPLQMELSVNARDQQLATAKAEVNE